MNNITALATPLRAQAGATEPFEWVAAAGARVAVMRRGKGKPVICLHAIGHGARDYEAFAARVGDSFEIIALDWPGQGRSPAETAGPTARRYAEILLGLIDVLNLDRPIVIGNSIGGAAALTAVASAPQRFGALVLCNSGGLVAINATARFVIKRMVNFFRAGEEGRRWFKPAFALYYRLVLSRRMARSQRSRIIASAYEIAPVLRAAWEGFGTPDANLRALAGKVTCPVWIAWARGDKIIAWSRCRRAVREFPSKRIEFFRGGHAAFLESPDEFARGFRSFVDRGISG